MNSLRYSVRSTFGFWVLVALAVNSRLARVWLTVRGFSVEVGSRYRRSQRGFGGAEINERLRPQTGGVNEQCALRRYLGTSRTFKARSKSHHCRCNDCAESAGTIAISPSTCA